MRFTDPSYLRAFEKVGRRSWKVASPWPELHAAIRLLEEQLHQRTMYKRERLAVIARDGNATVATLAARLGSLERIPVQPQTLP